MFQPHCYVFLVFPETQNRIKQLAIRQEKAREFLGVVIKTQAVGKI